MKILHTYLQIFVLFIAATRAEAIDFNSIPYIGSEEYIQKSNGDTRSKILLKIGNSLDLIDFEEQINDALEPYEKDLSPYFKPGELRALVATINQKAETQIIGSKITEDKAKKVLELFGNELIGKIADRIMDKQGITDPASRASWTKFILKPYQNCHKSASNALYQAKHCLETLASVLVPNAATALVYELSKTNLASQFPKENQEKFLSSQIADQIRCVQKMKSEKIKRDEEILTSDYVNCAVGIMKNGVSKVIDVVLPQKVLPSLNQNRAAFEKIKTAVMPAFNTCLSSVGTKPDADLTKEFYGCIDRIVIDTGSEVVKYKVLNTDALKTLFKNDINKVSAEKASDFKNCMKDLVVKNDRVEGMLNLQKCEDKVTNDLTFLVVSNSFNEVAATASVNPSTNKELETTAKNIINSCWSPIQNANQREACVRKSIISFSSKVAEISINEAIPNDLPTKKMIFESGVSDLTKCLQSNLPEKPSEDPTLSTKLDKCKNEVTLSVAMRTAEDSIKDLGKDLPSEILGNHIKTIVQQNFKKCIGTIPETKKLNKCVESLKIEAAEKLSSDLFNLNIDQFVKENGGVEKLKTSAQLISDLKAKIKNVTNSCIQDDKNATDVMIPINACMKTSIKKLALELGTTLYNASVGTMYDKRPDIGSEFKVQFQNSLGECLSKKDKPEFSITDYTSNLTLCSDQVAKLMMTRLGTDQVDFNINSYLADTPSQNLKTTREELRKKILGNFNLCLKTKKESSDCIDVLKKEATSNIVLAYGKSQIKNQLAIDFSPNNIKAIENDFQTCTDSHLKGDELSAKLDDCIKFYALNFARELGVMKVLPLLKKTLGSSDFENNKLKIDKLITSYKKCLSDLESVAMNDGLIEKLTICTKNLENNTIGFVQSIVNNWMNENGSSEKVNKDLKEAFANFLPCLGTLLPSSPWTEEDTEQKIDPILKPVAVLLGQYIDYDINVANKTINEIVGQLFKDLSEVGFDGAKNGIIDLLANNGALDQLLKTMVKQSVTEGFLKVDDKTIPAEIKEELTSRETINAIFKGEFGEKIKRITLESILKPVVIDGEDMNSKKLLSAQDNVKNLVIQELAQSPKFGTRLIDYSIEKSLKETGWLTKMVGSMLYSKDAFVWKNLKTTPTGKKAEQFIRDEILLPQFQGKTLDKKEEKDLMKKAEEKVVAAVKNYKKETGK